MGFTIEDEGSWLALRDSVCPIILPYTLYIYIYRTAFI